MTVLKDDRNYFAKLSQASPEDKVGSEYWSDDEIESYYIEQSNKEYGELNFDGR